MKRMAFLLAVFLTAGLLVTTSAKRLPDEKIHKFTAVVVSVNTAAKTITFTTDDGKEKTTPVEGKAEDVYKDLKAGDKVELTCHDNEKGEHKAIHEIVLIKAPWRAIVIAITIKAEDGTEKTVPVEGKTIEALKDLKAGDKIELTCHDNDAGEHQAVSAIAKAKAAEKKPESKHEPKSPSGDG